MAHDLDTKKLAAQLGDVLFAVRTGTAGAQEVAEAAIKHLMAAGWRPLTGPAGTAPEAAVYDVRGRYFGHQPRDCGNHRTFGSHRAWCGDCRKWCYPHSPCAGCQTTHDRVEPAASTAAELDPQPASPTPEQRPSDVDKQNYPSGTVIVTPGKYLGTIIREQRVGRVRGYAVNSPSYNKGMYTTFFEDHAIHPAVVGENVCEHPIPHNCGLTHVDEIDLSRLPRVSP